MNLLLELPFGDLPVHVPLILLFLQLQFLLHVLHPLHVAGHRVQGVELDEADLAVERLLVALLLLRSHRVRLAK